MSWRAHDENWREKYIENNLGESGGDFWHPDDKGWVKVRKSQWRDVKLSLDVLSANSQPFKRKYHKYHQELFFTGNLDPECRLESSYSDPVEGFLATGHAPFLGLLPVFKLWYHPKPDDVDLDTLRQRNQYLKYANFALNRSEFMGCWSRGANFSGKVYSPVYGMMGGREELVVRFFYPSLDYRESVSTEVTGPNNSAAPHPDKLMKDCYFGTVTELRRDAAFVPYAPGQYLWDHMSFNMECYPDEIFIKRTPSSIKLSELWRNKFKVLIAEILTFEQRNDASRNRPTTIAMVERIIGKYERKEFSDSMLAFWDECKRDIKELTSIHREFFYEDNERLSKKYGGFPVGKINERVEQWKQI